MNRFKTAAGIFALAALTVVGGAQSARADQTTANVDLNLQIESNLNIEVDTPSVTVTPTLAEIIANSVSRGALFNLINIRSTANYDVNVSGDNNQIVNSDIVLNAGDGDITVPLAGTAKILTNKSGPTNGDTYPVGVTINNLQSYSVGTHTTTLTFEITAADGGA